jgi:hypothetical protein
VKQQLGKFRVRDVLREFEQGFASWAADTLRIGKVLMDDSIECVDQLFFVVHRCGFASVLKQNPTIDNPCR